MGVDMNLKRLDLTRRDALKLALAPLGAAAATSLLAGCAEDRDALGSRDEDPNDLSQVVAGDAGSAAAADGDLTHVPWASGGTKSMKGGYPDPFGGAGAGTTCDLYPALTLGPCYAQGPVNREDISDGFPGLPLRLSFLVVSSSGCKPIQNANIDIWHTSAAGVYSQYASGVCNPNRAKQPTGAEAKYNRGTRNTDANGRADFTTVFPGHYNGRSIHIHFTVRINNRAYQTSQLFFDDALTDEIMLTKDYVARGRRQTTNKTDHILNGVDLNKVLMSTAKRSDGALHAWKVISIKS